MDEDIAIDENYDEMYEYEEDQGVQEDVPMTDAEENREYAIAHVREVIVLDDKDRMTSDRVSMFEYTELIGIRAEDIARHDNCFVSIEGLTDPIKMAEREFAMRKCPLKIRREVGYQLEDGKAIKIIEYLDPNVAIHPSKSLITDDKF